MTLSTELNKKVRAYIINYGHWATTQEREANIFSCGFDIQLKNLITFNGSPSQFVPLMISLILDYGTLNDGREGIVALLESVISSCGKDGREYGKKLIEEVTNSSYILPPIEKKEEVKQPVVESDVTIITLRCQNTDDALTMAMNAFTKIVPVISYSAAKEITMG